MTEKTKNKTKINLLGVLPAVVAWLLLASVGTCGDSCQSCTQSGISGTIKALRGEP